MITLWRNKRMNSYRHINILVNAGIYHQLKELSYKKKVPMSKLVREGIHHILKGNKMILEDKD